MKLVKVFAFISVCCITFLTSCHYMIADLAISSFPTYKELIDKWPSIKEGEARIIVYLPKEALPAKALLDLGYTVAQTGYSVSSDILVDDSWKINLIDRTFIFLDLEKGNHQIKYRDNILNIQIPERKIRFINIASGKLKVVEENEALVELKELHHAFKTYLPLNDQGDIYKIEE